MSPRGLPRFLAVALLLVLVPLPPGDASHVPAGYEYTLRSGWGEPVPSNSSTFVYVEYQVSTPSWTSLGNVTHHVLVDGVLLKSVFRSPEMATTSVWMKIPWFATGPGIHRLEVRFDVDDNVTEVDETNNVVERTLYVQPRVDLALHVLSVSSEPVPADATTLAVSAEVCNLLTDGVPGWLDVELWQTDALGYTYEFATQRVVIQADGASCATYDVTFRDIYGAGRFEARAKVRPGIGSVSYRDPNILDNTDSGVGYRLVDAPGLFLEFPLA